MAPINKAPDAATDDALRAVRAAGSDLSRPMVVDFYVAVPNAVAGRAVAAEVLQRESAC